MQSRPGGECRSIKHETVLRPALSCGFWNRSALHARERADRFDELDFRVIRLLTSVGLTPQFTDHGDFQQALGLQPQGFESPAWFSV
jgi:hypothetical protein